MEINSGPSAQTQIEVLKKSTEVQEQAVTQLLDASAQQLEQQRDNAEQTQSVSGSALTGLGTGIDINA